MEYSQTHVSNKYFFHLYGMTIQPNLAKKILEAEVIDGCLKLHDLSTFDKALKLGWLKRYFNSQGKWKVVLDLEDFHENFNYGNDFVERMYEIIQIPFWKDVLGCLKILFKSDTCTSIHHV